MQLPSGATIGFVKTFQTRAVLPLNTCEQTLMHVTRPFSVLMWAGGQIGCVENSPLTVSLMISPGQSDVWMGNLRRRISGLSAASTVVLWCVCVCARARVRACVRVCDERVQIGSYIWLPQSRSQRVVLFWSVCIFSFLSSECVNSAHLSLLAYLCTIKHHFASLCNRTVTSVLSCWFRREQAPSHSFRGVGYQPFCPPHSDTTRCRAVELTGVKPCE